MRVVIIGAGQVGSAIIGALASERVDVVVLDVRQDRLKELRDTYDIQTICGSGSNPKVLDDASVASAEMIVAVTDSDEVNMVASAISGMRAPHAIKVARIREKAFVEDATVLSEQGFRVDHPINPELVAATRVVDILDIPIASDVADCGPGLKLVGIRIPEDTPLEGMTFAEFGASMPTLKVLAINRGRAGEAIIPKGDDDIRSGDNLYIVARTEDLPEVARVFHLPWRPAKRITIAGGTGIGEIIAKRLEEQGRSHVKLIEANPTRAEELAESFNKVLVLQGVSTDESLLLEENIRDCDVFIAALLEEETNVMAALNAKRLGAHRVIVLTNKLSYIPIIENAGVDVVVSPRALAIGTILQHVRKGRVKRVIPYGQTGEAEAIEFEALDSSNAVGKPLRSLRFPEGAIIGALIRDGKAIIPGGDDIIAPGDRVFIFADKSAVPKIEKLMSVSINFF